MGWEAALQSPCPEARNSKALPGWESLLQVFLKSLQPNWHQDSQAARRSQVKKPPVTVLCYIRNRCPLGKTRADSGTRMC